MKKKEVIPHKCTNPDCQNILLGINKTCSGECRRVVASINSRLTKVRSPWYGSKSVGKKKKL